MQHQTIHIYRLENGLFVEVVKLGRTLHDTDEYLLNVTGQSQGQQASTLPHSRAYGPRPYRNYREGVINQLKHRILVFLYRRAVAISLCKEDGHPYQIRKFYQRREKCTHLTSKLSLESNFKNMCRSPL